MHIRLTNATPLARIGKQTIRAVKMEAEKSYDALKKFWKKRALKIVKLKNEGKSFAEIGKGFLISRQRAEQIWKNEVDK